MPKVNLKMRKRDPFPFPLAVLVGKKETKDNGCVTGLLFAKKREASVFQKLEDGFDDISVMKKNID